MTTLLLQWRQMAWLGCCLSALTLGCAESGTAPPSDGDSPVKNTDQPGDDHGHDHAHDHPDHGPHGGDLVELGAEEYHAEVVHDDEAKTLTVYILDSTAKKTVPIDAERLLINLKLEGKPEQIEVAAEPLEGDPEGQSSRFVSKDERLLAGIDAQGSNPRLMVQIGDKSYNGAIEHHHDHEH